MIVYGTRMVPSKCGPSEWGCKWCHRYVTSLLLSGKGSRMPWKNIQFQWIWLLCTEYWKVPRGSHSCRAVWEEGLIRGSKRSNSHLGSKQLESRLSVECGQESRLWRGPGRKQQPSAGHLSDIHLGFIIKCVKSVSIQCGGQETRDQVAADIIRPLRSVVPPQNGVKPATEWIQRLFDILQQKYLTYDLPTNIFDIRSCSENIWDINLKQQCFLAPKTYESVTAP